MLSIIFFGSVLLCCYFFVDFCMSINHLLKKKMSLIFMVVTYTLKFICMQLWMSYVFTSLRAICYYYE